MSDQPAKHKNDREYALAVIRKQLGVDAEAAVTILKKIASRGKPLVDRLVIVARAGLLAEVREILTTFDSKASAEAPPADPPASS